jgi:hypothetical protein
MSPDRRIALVIVLSTALLGAAGALRGFFTTNAAVGIAICGIVIGTGVARGAFAATRPANQKSADNKVSSAKNRS